MVAAGEAEGGGGSGGGSPIGAERIYSAVARMLQEGVAESKGRPSFQRGRVRAERAIADAYGGARPPAGAWGEALAVLGGAAVHAAHSTAPRRRRCRTVAQAKAADEALRWTGELRSSCGMKATRTLARAKAELAKRQRASEGAQHPTARRRLLASRGEAGGGGRARRR